MTYVFYELLHGTASAETYTGTFRGDISRKVEEHRGTGISVFP